LLLVETTTCATFFTREQKLLEFNHKLASSPTSSQTKMSNRVLYPSEYGADPTGSEESSDAIMKAVEDAFKLQKGIELVAGVNDLGGVVIDLGGGDYKISKPITFSPGGGNIVLSICSFSNGKI
ncbi:hypothetical protein TSUD_66850, partial [Trifolium subterraneum]